MVFKAFAVLVGAAAVVIMLLVPAGAARVALGDKFDCVDADLNMDGLVDVNDLNMVLVSWNEDPGDGPSIDNDLDNDGSVDVDDMLNILMCWGSVINTSLRVSSTMGTAPHAVFFDALGELPWRNGFSGIEDLDFSWDFDSDGIVDDFGFQAAHVYDAPGVFLVSLEVRDVAGNSRSFSEEIEVIDFEALFPEGTYCFSNSGDFSGCPTSVSARQITTSELAPIAAKIAPGRQLLLERGSAFEGATSLAPLQAENLIISDFGDQALSKPVIRYTGGGTLINDPAPNTKLVRLRIEGTPCADFLQLSGGDGGFYANNFLLYQSELSTWQHGIHENTGSRFDNLFIASSELDSIGTNCPSGGYSLFANTGQNIAIKDSSISNCLGGNHAIRTIAPERLLVSGSLFEDFSCSSAMTIRGVTKDVLIRDNVFQSNKNINISTICGEANCGNVTDAVEHVIIESNIFHDILELRQGQYIAIRNNLFHSPEAVVFLPAVIAGVPRELGNVRIYHNTHYSPDYARFIRFGLGGEYVGSIEILNNVFQSREADIFTPYSFMVPQVLDALAGHLEIDHNLYYLEEDPLGVGGFAGNLWMPGWGAWQEGGFDTNGSFTQSEFVDALSGDFNLQPTSPAVDAGRQTNVQTDYAQGTRPRGSAADIGAFERE